MIINYLKIALRNLYRNKLFSLINIAGFAIGMVCCMLIAQYILYESNYDNFHKDAERIYRVNLEIESTSGTTRYAMNVPPAAPTLKKNFSQVEEAARVLFWQSARSVKQGEKLFYEDGFVYADPSIFNILTYQFIAGNQETALTNPSTVVIPKRLAQKYFPNDNAVGKTLNINNRDYQVTGVITDAKPNTHLPFDIFISMHDLNNPPWMDDWTWPGMWTYIKLSQNVNTAIFKNQITNLADPYLPGDKKNIYRYSVQPLLSIYLNEELEYDAISGNVIYLYLFSAIGLIVLLIACFNFMNLMTAKATLRAKEVGIRKTAGASHTSLISQFLFEAFFVSFTAFMLSILLYELIFPFFENLTGITAQISTTQLIVFGILFSITGMAAGIYPAFVLSSFKPTKALGNTINSIYKKSKPRNILVFSQFAISGILIVSALVVYNQTSFMKKLDPGFNSEQKIILPVRGRVPLMNNYQSVKNEFQNLSSVTAVGISSLVPGQGAGSLQTKLLHQDGDGELLMYYFFCEPDFVSQYEMEIIAGRNFSNSIQTDISNACLVNESAVKALGWTDPFDAIGKKLETGLNKTQKEIIGIIKNYNYRSAHFPIEPLIIEIEPSLFARITLSINNHDIKASIHEIENKWAEIFPDKPFEYFYFDDFFNSLYDKEETIGSLFNLFSLIGLFIACLGLWGLSSFITNRRNKEIGIRKVLGSSISGITVLLSKDFLKFVLYANLISWPIAWIIMDKWLQNFAYRIEISWWIFVLSGGLTLIIALLTVSSQAIKAALANPIKALRYE